MSQHDAPFVPTEDDHGPQHADGVESSAVVLRLPRQRSRERDAVLARDLMVRWCRELSPRRSVRLADRDAEGTGWANNYPDAADVEQAGPDQPVAMRLTRRGATQAAVIFVFLVWDLDAKLLGAAQVARDEARLTAFLEAAGIGVVAASSGPGGGRHLWTACPQGLAQQLVTRIARAAQKIAPSLDLSTMRGVQAAARVPGSPHRHGGYVRLDAESPADVEAAIRLLRAGTPRSGFELLAGALAAEAETIESAAGDCTAFHRPAAHAAAVQRPINTDAEGQATGLRKDKRPNLTSSTAAALARELDAHENHSAHAARVLVGLALAGWQREDVQRAALAAAGLEHLRSERVSASSTARTALSPQAAAERLARQWDRAVRFAAGLPAPASVVGDEDQAAEARRLAEAAVCVALELIDGEEPGRWGGKWKPSGPADLATVLHALLVMLRTGRTEAELPCRSVARGTTRHHDTAARALWRLNEDRIYLERAAPAEGPHGARYGLPAHILDEARRRLAADLPDQDQSGAHPDDATTPPDKTAGQSHDRGEAAPPYGAPTQGTPPPLQVVGLITPPDPGRDQSGALRPVIRLAAGEDQPQFAPSGPSPVLPCPLPGHERTAACPDQGEQAVTTDQKQDQQRRDHDQLPSFDPAAARDRLHRDLRILSADLFSHGTGGDDLGRHCAVTLLTLTHEVRRRGAIEEWELADATGLTVRTVARHLRALERRDLVTYSPRDGGWYPTGVDVGDVDQGEGEGTAARRARRHRIDAIVWAWWQSELAWLRMDLAAKSADARHGRRRQPYGQQLLGEVGPEMFAHLRYPRREARITSEDGQVRRDLVPDHAEAAAIVRARIREAEQPAGRPAPTAPAGPSTPRPAAPWTPPDLTGAPQFVIDAAAAELAERPAAA